MTAALTARSIEAEKSQSKPQQRRWPFLPSEKHKLSVNDLSELNLAKTEDTNKKKNGSEKARSTKKQLRWQCATKVKNATATKNDKRSVAFKYRSKGVGKWVARASAQSGLEIIAKNEFLWKLKPINAANLTRFFLCPRTEARFSGGLGKDGNAFQTIFNIKQTTQAVRNINMKYIFKLALLTYHRSSSPL